MDRGAWQATVCGILKSQTQLSGFHFHGFGTNELWLHRAMFMCLSISLYQTAPVVTLTSQGSLSSGRFNIFGMWNLCGNAMCSRWDSRHQKVIESINWRRKKVQSKPWKLCFIWQTCWGLKAGRQALRSLQRGKGGARIYRGLCNKDHVVRTSKDC